MGLLTRFLARFEPVGIDDSDLAEALERAAYRVEPHLKQTRGWPKRYRRPIAAALIQARRVSEAIPGPMEIDVEQFARAPFVRALFGSADDIHRILHASQAIRDYTASTLRDEVYALLSMRRVEKNTLGVESAGEIVRREVPQQHVWFTDHQLSGLAPSESEARENLLWTLFDHFLERVRVGVERLKAERDRLAREKDLALAHLRGVSSARRPELRKILDGELKQLTEITESLDLERLAEVFATVLSHPEDCLYLQEYSLALDNMGVVRPKDPTVASLGFVDLVERYQEPRTVVLVRCRNIQPISQSERLQEARRWLA